MPTTDTSWASLRELIRRRLGSGMVDVELTDSQIDDGISSALREFRMRSDASVKEGWMFLRIQRDQRIYSLPDFVEDVMDIERTNRAFFNSFENSQYANFLYSHLHNGAPFDLLTYHLERAFFDSLAIITASKIAFRFHSGLGGQQLGEISIVGSGLASEEQAQVPSTRPTGSTMVDTPAAPVDGSGSTIDTADKEMEFENRLRLDGPHLELLKRPRDSSGEVVLINLMYSRTDAELILDKMTGRFVSKYAMAESKITLGNAYRKFSAIPGPGGGLTLPGDALISEGKEEIEKLEQDVLDYLYGGEPTQIIFA